MFIFNKKVLKINERVRKKRSIFFPVVNKLANYVFNKLPKKRFIEVHVIRKFLSL